SITHAQNWEWSKLIQPADNKAYMTGMADPAGNVYMGGFFNQSIDFGNSKTLSGNWDGCIARFDTAGLCQWAQRIYVTTQGCGCTVEGNRSSAYVAGFDSNGNVIIYGGFCGCGEFFGGSTSSVPAAGYNIFIAKYSPSGTCLWVKTKPGSWNSSTGQTDDQIYTVTIDASDNIYIDMLSYATNTTFCGLTFAPQGEFFLKVNTNGVGIWKTQIATTTVGYTLAQLKYFNSRIYATAQYVGTVTFGTHTLTAQGSLDVAVLKMDTAGSYLAAVDFGGSGGQTGALGLAVSNDKIVVLGQAYTNSVSISAGTYTLNTGTGNDGTFLVTYDTTSLTPQAVRNTATDNNGSGTGLYNDNKGNLYLTATNSATTGFGGLSNVPAGHHVIRMDNTLTNYWYMQSVSVCVAPDTLGNIYTVDGFSGGTDVNGALGKIHNARTTGLGGARMAQTNTMQVYPNPSTGLFNLKLGTDIKHNNAKIVLYD